MNKKLVTITDLEQWAVHHSRLSVILPELPKTPVKLCSSFEEFVEPQISALSISSTIRSLLMKKRIDLMQQQLEEEDIVRGIFLPEIGCFINGYALAIIHDLKNGDQLFHNPVGSLELISTIIHEKYGHGFLSEKTTAGREIAANHLHRLRLANSFLASKVDTPESTLLHEKMNAVFRTSQFLEEGWAVWVEHYVYNKVVSHINEIVHTNGAAEVSFDNDLFSCSLNQTRETGTTIARYGRNESLRKHGEALITCIDYLAGLVFPDSQPDPHQALHIARNLELLADDGEFSMEFTYECGHSFIHCIGLLLMNIAAQKFGPSSPSVIARLACNVDLKIVSSSISDLKDFTGNTHNGNINARFLQLIALPSEGIKNNDTEAVKQLARDILSFPY